MSKLHFGLSNVNTEQKDFMSNYGVWKTAESIAVSLILYTFLSGGRMELCKHILPTGCMYVCV